MNRKNKDQELIKLGEGFLEAIFSSLPYGDLIYYPWKYREELSSSLSGIAKRKQKKIQDWVSCELRNLLAQATPASLSLEAHKEAFNKIAHEFPRYLEQKLPEEALIKARPNENYSFVGLQKAFDDIRNSNERTTISIASIQFACIFSTLNLMKLIDPNLNLTISSFMGADQADQLSEPLPHILIFPVTTFSKRIKENSLLKKYQLVSVPHKIKSSIAFRKAKIGGALNIHGLGKGVSIDVINKADKILQRKIEVASWGSEDFMDYIGFVNFIDEGELYSGFDPFLTLFDRSQWNIIEDCTVSSAMGIFVRNDISKSCRESCLAIAKLIHISILELQSKIVKNPGILYKAAHISLSHTPFSSRITELYDKFTNEDGPSLLI